VNVIVDLNFKNFRNEVIFSGWVSLDDISSLSSYVEVVNSSCGWNSRGSWLNVEHVRSVLEGSSVLVGIQSEFEFVSILSFNGILFDWGSISIGSMIGEGSRWSIAEICGRNVVSDSEDTFTVIVINAFQVITRSRKGPVVGGSVSIDGVSEVIFTRMWGNNAIRGTNSPGFIFYPFTAILGTFNLVVPVGIGSIGGYTVMSAFDIERIAFIERAIRLFLNKDSNISPL